LYPAHEALPPLVADANTTIGERSPLGKTVANVVGRADIAWPSVLHSTQRREALHTKQLVMDWRFAKEESE